MAAAVAPQINGRTQEQMYETLHRSVETWRSELAFIPRRIPCAYEAIETWLRQGILEMRDVPLRSTATGRTHTRREYRLTTAGIDPVRALDDIHVRLHSFAKREQRIRDELHQRETTAHDGWRELCHDAGAITAAADGQPDTEQMCDVAARTVQHASRVVDSHRRCSALRNTLETIRAERAELEAVCAHLEDHRAPMADPLGGDA